MSDKEERPPQPGGIDCGHCSWAWVKGMGWVPRWNYNCPVHLSSDDLPG